MFPIAEYRLRTVSATRMTAEDPRIFPDTFSIAEYRLIAVPAVLGAIEDLSAIPITRTIAEHRKVTVMDHCDHQIRVALATRWKGSGCSRTVCAYTGVR